MKFETLVSTYPRELFCKKCSADIPEEIVELILYEKRVFSIGGQT